MTKRTCVTASSGYSSAQAFRSASSTDALLELQRVPAEVVITDIIMPKLNGVDAISLIVQKFPMVRIVAISGGGNFDTGGNQPAAITTTTYLAAARKAGAHFVLTKPFESHELIGAVDQVIAGST